MGVTRPFLTVVEGEQAGNDTTRAARGVEGEMTGNETTRSATRVGPRCIEACLGGQDDDVGWVDVGSKTDRSSYQNGDDWQGRNCSHSGFIVRRMSLEVKRETTSVRHLREILCEVSSTVFVSHGEGLIKLQINEKENHH